MCQAACQPWHIEKDGNRTCPHGAYIPTEDSEVKMINDELKSIADMLSAMKETHRAETCVRWWEVGVGTGASMKRDIFELRHKI